MEYKYIEKVSKKTIKTRDVYNFLKITCENAYKSFALKKLRAELNGSANDSHQINISITVIEAKRLLRALDRVQGAAEILAEILEITNELSEAGLHKDVVRALEMDAVPLSEYKALAADYLRLSRAFDTAQKNLEAITEAQQAAFNSDKVIIETFINWKNGR